MPTNSATYQPPENENNAQSVERLTRLSTGVNVLTEDGFAVPVTRDAKGDMVSLEAFMAAPSRIKQSVSIQSITSFTDYIARHGNESSMIFFDRDSERFVFVADYHGKDGKAAWCDNVATLQLTRTPSCQNWIAKHNQQFGQEAFGLFIEENASDIVNPSAAVMMQLATEMKAKKDVEFESSVKLDNGSFVFGYKESVGATFNNGQTQVPADFQIGFVPFRGMKDGFKLDAKFRYRISSSRLALWYTIPLLAKMIDDALDEVMKSIAETTKLPVIEGSIDTQNDRAF